jgi:hypothetical protein
MNSVKKSPSSSKTELPLSGKKVQDQKNSCVTTEKKEPRLNSRISSSSFLSEPETTMDSTEQALKADGLPNVSARGAAENGTVGNDVSAEKGDVNSAEYVLFNWALESGISTADIRDVIWPLCKSYLPVSLDDKERKDLKRVILIVCDRILKVEKEKIEHVHACVGPLSDVCATPLDKILFFDSILGMKEELVDAVGDAVIFTTGDNKKRNELNGLVSNVMYEEEDLRQWLEDNSSARSGLLEMTKKYGLSPEENGAVLQQFLPVLPRPWRHEYKALLELLCGKLFQVNSESRGTLFNAIKPLFFYCKAEYKLWLPIVFLGVPEHQRENLVKIFLSSMKSRKTTPPLFMEYLNRDEKWIDARIKAINCLIVDIHQEDKEIEKHIGKKFRILKVYTACNRSPNEAHLATYGGRSVQGIFQKSQREGLHFALHCISQSPATTDEKKAFRDVLIGLGNRRMRAAYLCHPQHDWERFGCLVTPGEASTIWREKLVSTYKEWAAKIIAGGSNKITIDGKTYTLTEVDKRGLTYCYDLFWEENNPVFSYAAGVYAKLTRGMSLEPETLRTLLSELHWLMVEVLPFLGGTAAIAETLTDAIWIAHGYIPPEGKCLDLLALSMPQKDFSKVYPMGKSRLLSHIDPVFIYRLDETGNCIDRLMQFPSNCPGLLTAQLRVSPSMGAMRR